MTPEGRLCAAIITQALDDMSAPKMMSSDIPELDGKSAISFLTANFGASARWRNHLCSLIDMDGDVLRTRVIDYLEGRRDFPVAYAQDQESRDLTARRRWAEMQTRQPRRVSQPAIVPRPVSRSAIAARRDLQPSIAPRPTPPDTHLSTEDFYAALPDVPFTLDDLGIPRWFKSAAWNRILRWVERGHLIKIRPGLYSRPQSCLAAE